MLMNTQSRRIVLKKGKDKAIRHRHHWIFSGAVEHLPNFKNGEILPVYSSEGDLLGSGYFNRASGIVGRMLSFGSIPPLEALENKLERAFQKRSTLINFEETNGYRLVNAEGDEIPGLVLDVYDQTIVLQSSTLGIDLLKPFILDWLNRKFQPQAIYEKSLSASRREEGVGNTEGLIFGTLPEKLIFKENNLQFFTDLEKSQKTGFFLDHREMRLWTKELAKERRVLNAFSYTGGFSLYALAGGAKSVDSLDISGEAINAAKLNANLNGYSEKNQNFFCEDVFDFFRAQKDLPYDLVILDPPAFAKKKKDIIPACRGYKDINRLAMMKMPPQSLLLTCSCSHFINEELFAKVLFQAALEAKREVCIVGRHRLAPDHPINLFHPEGHYLKSFVLWIV